jgi:hypothetical protein
VNTPVSEHVELQFIHDIFNTFQVLGYDMSKFPNVTKWYSEVKKAIEGYDEIQNAAAVVLKQMFESHPE